MLHTPATLTIESLAGLVAHNPQIITAHDGSPVAALIDYELYETLLETIDEWYAGQRAAAAYEAWKQDPSRGMDWEEFKAELMAEGRLDA